MKASLILVLAAVAMAAGSPAPSPDPSPKPSWIRIPDGQNNIYQEAWPVDDCPYNQWDSAPWDETLYPVQLAPNAAASTSEVTKTTTVVNHPSVHPSVRPSVLPPVHPAVIRPWPSTPQYLPSTSTSSVSASASSASNAGGIVPTNAPGYYPIGSSMSSAAAAASAGLSSNAPGTMISMNAPANLRWGDVYYPNQGQMCPWLSLRLRKRSGVNEEIVGY